MTGFWLGFIAGFVICFLTILLCWIVGTYLAELGKAYPPVPPVTHGND